MPYSAPTTIVTGQLVTAALMNTDWAGNITFLANPPACRVYNNAALTPATATLFALTFNSERYDTDSMHDTVTNNHRITINTAGLYVLQGHVQFASNATGFRGLMIFLNATGSNPITGGTRIASEYRTTNNGDFTEVSISTIYKFAVGDWVQLIAYQTSGAGLNVNAAGNYSPEFAASWVGLG